MCASESVSVCAFERACLSARVSVGRDNKSERVYVACSSVCVSVREREEFFKNGKMSMISFSIRLLLLLHEVDKRKRGCEKARERERKSN